MTRQLTYFAAIVLLLTGAIKMSVKAMHQETLLIPTCMGNALSVSIGAPDWGALHCWGCYAVIIGLIMITGLCLTQSRADDVID